MEEVKIINDADDVKMIDKDVLDYIINKKSLKNNYFSDKEIIPKVPQAKLIEYVVRAQKENKKLLIVHTQGAYNPPHIGHINMILDTRDVVEKSEGYILLAAYMSPSPDTHIDKKKQQSLSQGEDYLHLSFDERCFLIERMISNLGYQDWIFVNRYEGVHEKVSVTKTWINMQEFAQEMIQETKEALKLNDVNLASLKKLVEVAFLIGSDKLNYKSKTMDEFSKEVKVDKKNLHLPIIIKQRAELNNEKAQAKMAEYTKYKKEEQIKNKVFVCTDRENFSSTQFREYIKKIQLKESV
ncbi:hypothetical protein ABPG72_005578 [Tetrahymena utriculariae]